MKITRYNQNKIGGSIVKITSDSGDAILIDYGICLDGWSQEEVPDLCDVKGIFITHFHYDHMGLLNGDLDIPVYVNEMAFKSFMIYASHMHLEFDCDFRFIKPNEEFKLSDFRIKPIPCSHSAYQSMMYFITVDDRNILHTGDFRLHGMNYNNLDCFKDIKDNLDVLITEGTNINNDLEANTEEDIKNEFLKLESKYKYIYVLASSTNYERIKTINDSVRRGRYFVTDDFQDEIMKSWGSDFKNVVYGGNLHSRLMERGFVFLIRPTDYFRKIMDEFPTEKSILVYSMWRGYLDMSPSLNDFMSSYEYKFIHTSGHVSKPDLERFINYLNPIDVMAIHTEHEEAFNEMHLKANIIYDEEVEYAWVYMDPKCSNKYNDAFKLEHDERDISVPYLEKVYNLSFQWATLLNDEIRRYQNEAVYSFYLERIDSLDYEIITREKIAYEFNICLSFADELLERHLSLKTGE